ncbi:PQQ-like beta-propeller repeat protein [Roseiconus nitratireducens]|uniref:PQQ-like beta-propeller repeat protein n=1 Tax=Roseiconus nitratireducens TaxID=2605748 RepID=A0A5M6DEJ1_9BACT|nr:PQQ-binding-like beta-propeller repeat protein [Roseiconus nitratireducens]KAA5545948.1 PQQ-like beta-propeller repeat protein [Roseiconus nitratireducens]
MLPRFFLLSVLLASATLAAGIAASQDVDGRRDSWTRFRGPQASGVADADLPVQWSDQKNLAWKTELPGKGSSSPVVWNDHIYLTAYDGYGLDVEDPGERSALRLHVLCIGLDNGELIWDCEIEPSSEEQPVGKRIAEHGYASPTPCADGSAVYASFGPSGVAAVSHDGELLWRRNVGGETAGFGAAASPILYRDLVIQNASIESGKLFALDKATGEIRWQADSIDRAWTTPTLVELPGGKTELIVNQKGAVLGFDPDTGDRLWQCDAIGDYVVPCVIARGDVLYCSGGRSNKTFAIRAGGRGDVSESHLLWEQSRGANVTSPILVGDYLYWSHDKAIALCLRASDGEEMFRERMPTRARVYASIVSDGKRLFLTTRDAGVLVLDAGPKYNELAVNRLGDSEERFNATPAIVGDRLLLRSDQCLYCIRTDSN